MDVKLINLFPIVPLFRGSCRTRRKQGWCNFGVVKGRLGGVCRQEQHRKRCGSGLEVEKSIRMGQETDKTSVGIRQLEEKEV